MTARPIILGACALAAGLCWSASTQELLDREAPNNRSADAPRLNRSPKNLLVIRGRKDPRLELVFTATYSTTNPACESRSIPAAMFGAPKVPQSVYDPVRVPRTLDQFTVSIYLDRYQPGGCNWQPIAVLYYVTSLDIVRHSAHHGLVAVRQDGPRTVKLSFICGKWSPPHETGSERAIMHCEIQPHLMTEVSLSPQGGVVELEYTLIPDKP